MSQQHLTSSSLFRQFITRRNTSRRYGSVLLVVFTLLSGTAFSGTALAGELKGRLSSDLYFYEQNDQNHLRAYESLRANWTLWSDSMHRSVTLRSYARWTTDLKTKRSTDPQLFLYDGYLQLNRILKRTTIKVGRQFVYSGAGSALLDGVRTQYRSAGRWRIDFFTGATVSRIDPETVRKFSDYNVYGSRFSYRVNDSWRLGLNWARNTERGVISLHRLGLDVDYQARALNFYGRWLHNLHSKRLSAVLGRVSYSSGLWYYSAEYQYREPSVSGATLFSLIDFYSYKEVRFEAQRKLGKSLAAFSRVDISYFDDENSARVSLGIRSHRLSVAWRQQGGDAGDRSGLYGYASKQLGNNSEVFISGDLSQYRVQEAQRDLNDSYSGALGVESRFSGSWRVRTEGQYLKNAVDDSDWRLLLSLSKNFTTNKRDRGR